MKDVIKILAIETASEACSAALLIADITEEAPYIFSRIELTPRQHAKLILPMLDEVLEEGEIALEEVDAIAFGRGPGAFTGLRIAAGVAQGVALSVDKPVIPVSTLSALALQAVDILCAVDGEYNDEIIAVATDARMGEMYWGIFRFNDKNMIELLGEEKVSKPEDVYKKVSGLLTMMPENRVVCIGSGWDVYEDEIFKEGKADNLIHMKSALPNAVQVAELAMDLLIEGKTVKAEDAQPVYIRNDVAKKPQKQS